MKGGGTQDAEGDSEQLCPPHVQAVYMLQGSSTADNISAISKVGLGVCCCVPVKGVPSGPSVQLWVNRAFLSAECVRIYAD